tara:strand:+ start:6682 stop:7110 length:429 start_codon:yes stop_codon:yes gene_type:complete
MNREKTLVLFMVLAIIVYFRGFIIGLIPKSNKVSSAIMGNVNVSNPKPEEERLGALDYSSVQLLSISVDKWGNDIFHDRSNVYNNKFKLTGITRFENGFKAIINDDIALEGESVQGFVVADINENRVLLKRNKHRVTLKLEE